MDAQTSAHVTPEATVEAGFYLVEDCLEYLQLTAWSDGISRESILRCESSKGSGTHSANPRRFSTSSAGSLQDGSFVPAKRADGRTLGESRGPLNEGDESLEELSDLIRENNQKKSTRQASQVSGDGKTDESATFASPAFPRARRAFFDAIMNFTLSLNFSSTPVLDAAKMFLLGHHLFPMVLELESRNHTDAGCDGEPLFRHPISDVPVTARALLLFLDEQTENYGVPRRVLQRMISATGDAAGGTTGASGADAGGASPEAHTPLTAEDYDSCPGKAALSILFELILLAEEYRVSPAPCGSETPAAGGGTSDAEPKECGASQTELRMASVVEYMGLCGVGSEKDGQTCLSLPLPAALKQAFRARRDLQNLVKQLLLKRVTQILSTYAGLTRGEAHESTAGNSIHRKGAQQIIGRQILHILHMLRDPDVSAKLSATLFKSLCPIILCEDIEIRRVLTEVFQRMA